MENNNGRGIFYGVMGVATLVVAIIGATFAFFAASASGNAGAVGANSVNLAGTLKLSETPDVRTNIIPTTETIMKSSYVQTGTGAKAKCKGTSQADTTAIYDLCSSYEFTLTNTATVAQQVYVSFTTVANSFKNLKYCIFEGSGTTATETVACKDVPATGAADAAFNVIIPADNGNVTYTVVLYVNETGGDQTDADSGKAFTGTISATTTGGENKVTGVLAA